MVKPLQLLPDDGAAPVAMRPLTFLIVDDERVNLMVLQAILEHDGHRVLTADNGQEAVERFQAESPDVVLMDVMMPVLDGYEATRRIKAGCGERFVPVIFLTALTDEHALALCVEAGGDDFLTKPYNRVILRSKIGALMRIHDLNADLQLRNAEISRHHNRLRQEHEAAETVLAKITRRGCLDSPGIRYLLSPMSIFNGDLLLAARRPSGGLRLMLGDFAGHGLSAAIGAMPAAETFYVMTSKGYAISDIVTEINRKMKLTLPTGMFLAASFIDIDPARGSLSVWNGGLPDALLCAAGGTRRLASRHLPLGVLDDSRFDPAVEILPLPPASRVLLYTDGLPDAISPAGERFGEQRLGRIVDDCCCATGLYDEITAAVAAFRQGAERSDDLTFAEIDCAAIAALVPEQEAAAGRRTPAAWRMQFELGVEVWREMDPLPLLLQLVTDVQGLHAHKERLYIILGELLSNALDHGLLRLDSHLKKDPQGFAQYYVERVATLAALHDGMIRVEFEHRPEGSGGRLAIHVVDSGPGFDHREKTQNLADNTGHSGRGAALVRSLCESFVYHGNGNHAEVVYRWT